MAWTDILKGGGFGRGLADAGGTGEWWKDPNFLATILGQGAQAVMGPHQQSWQAGFGKMGAGLGEANIYSRESRKREQEMMSMLARAFGFTPKGAPGATSAKINADGTYSLAGDLPTDESGLLKMGDFDPLDRGEALSIAPDQTSRFQELMTQGNFR